MPDITLSPIPYNGGTLTMTNANSHICHLSGNLFFAMFGQTVPNYTFATVYKVDNIKTTPVCTVLEQRAVSTTALTRCRIWKLSSNRVLALVNADLVVFEIDLATGAIVKKAAQILAFHSSYIWGTEAAGGSGDGMHLQGWYIKDNVVWIYQRTSATSSRVLYSITYDSVLDSLTKATVRTFAASTSNGIMWRCHIKKYLDSNNFLVFEIGGSTAWNLCNAKELYIHSDTGALVSTPSVTINPCAMAPMSASLVAGPTLPNTAYVYDGTAWGADAMVFTPNRLVPSSIVDAYPITSDYFLLVSTTSSIEIGSGTYSYRVVKCYGKSFFVGSPATAAGNGLSFATLNAYFDQQLLYKIDTEFFVSFGRASTSAFRIRGIGV